MRDAWGDGASARRGRLARLVVAAALLAGAGTAAGACSSGVDEGGAGDGAGDGGGTEDTTTTSAAPTSTTAPLGPPDPEVAPALVAPDDLDYMYDYPFGPVSAYRVEPRDRSRVDDLAIEPGRCAEIIADYLVSTGPGPSVQDIVSGDGALVIEQRVDREPDARERWEVFEPDYLDACADVAVTTHDGVEAGAEAGNFHLVQDFAVHPLAIEPVGDGARGWVLFVESDTVTHVLSAFTTAGRDVIGQEEMYDLVINVSVPAAHKLQGVLG
ncbi:MAG TPA: hypothetical protein VIL48_16925 [Acidimicrobiales bacterium]